MKKTYTAEQILNMLESQDFELWYQGEFNDFVTGLVHGEVVKSRKEILEDIKELL